MDGRKSAAQDAEERAQGAEAALRTIAEHSTRNALAATKGPSEVVLDGLRRILPNEDVQPERDVILCEGSDEDCRSIDGSPVVLYFEWPHTGWEMDQHAWVTDDGRVWGTNHGRLCELTMEELEEQQAQCCTWLAGTEAAIAKAKERARD